MVKITQSKIGTIRPIPPFKTLEEEANFWDTHSIIDDVDDGTMVGFHKANKTSTLTIRFEPKDLQRLRKKAYTLGVDLTALVRMWVKEKLQFQR